MIERHGARRKGPGSKGEHQSAPEKITVLHVILSLEIGGMEQVVADLVQNLDRTRFDPVVVCLESLGPIAEELAGKGIRVVLLPRMIRGLSFLYPAPLVKIIREARASVIHAHSGCLYKAVIAARFAGIRKIIYTEHGRRFPDGKAVIGVDRIFSRWTSCVVAVSRELEEYLCRNVGVSPKKITTIRNAIAVDDFNLAVPSTAPNEVVVGIIARLSPVKDIPTLLKGMQSVVREHPNVRLQIAGDGPERQRLEQLTQDLGLSSHVAFLGFRRDIPAVLSGIDIFALSSLSEGTSITLLEAMAAGKPVVVTRVGGNISLVENARNGFLVSPGRPDELADALLRLVRDPNSRVSMGLENRRKALQEFGLQAMVRQYESLYDSGFEGSERTTH